VNGLDDGGGSPCRDEDGGRSTCRAKLCFPGSDNQSDTAASGPGSSEEGDEGDDEESGLGSSDNDDKIDCSICQDADEHLRHVRGNSDLEDAMTELCGLSHSVCLHEWPPEIVFPKRIIALRGVGLSSKNLPKISLDLNSPEEGGHGLFHRPFFDVDRLVKGIPFPSSISIDDARKIGLKVPKNHRGGKIQLCIQLCCAL
jgi:hypothetical protein